MTVLEDRLRATARRLIEAAGKPMTLRRRTSPAYDPSTGQVTAVSTDFAVVGVLDDIETVRGAELVQRGDRAVLIAAAALDSDPTPGDIVVIDGAEHAVVAVEPSYAGAVPTLYRLIARC